MLRNGIVMRFRGGKRSATAWAGAVALAGAVSRAASRWRSLVKNVLKVGTFKTFWWQGVAAGLIV